MNDFTTTFTVDQAAKDVYDAITDVRGWWSEVVDGDTDKVGDEWTYQYQDVHRCRLRVTELVPGQKVSWLVLENHFNFVADSAEWTGTTISFDIADRDGRTEVRFSHLGLVPAYECFDLCSNEWGFYIRTSLRSLIETGKGLPNGPDGLVPRPA